MFLRACRKRYTGVRKTTLVPRVRRVRPGCITAGCEVSPVSVGCQPSTRSRVSQPRVRSEPVTSSVMSRLLSIQPQVISGQFKCFPYSRNRCFHQLRIRSLSVFPRSRPSSVSVLSSVLPMLGIGISLSSASAPYRC